MLFFREEVPSKLLSEYKPNSSVEKIFIEINLGSKKWLPSCSWSPNLTFQKSHTQNISSVIDFYSSKYIVLGDFSVKTSNTTISETCANYKIKNLIK